MFHRILVPVDFTSANQSALEIAADLSRPLDGLVCLLHVVQTIPGLPIADEASFYQRLEEAARKQLAEFGQRVEARSARWEATVTVGGRVQEILRLAMEHRIDLIVLSSHRIDPTDSTRGWGTLSYQVAVLAPCPVLLVK